MARVGLREVPRAALAQSLASDRAAGRARPGFVLDRRLVRARVGLRGLARCCCWHGTFTINSLSHLSGGRRYATDRRLAQQPRARRRSRWARAGTTTTTTTRVSARQGFCWWEIDVTYYVLRALVARRARLGLCTACRGRTCARTRLPRDAVDPWPRLAITQQSRSCDFPPANIQLRRAQLVLMLAVLVPTILMTVIGIILVARVIGARSTIVPAMLVLTFCTSGITGYILGDDLRRQGRVARARAERLRVERLARAAHAADVDPPAHRHRCATAGSPTPSARRCCRCSRARADAARAARRPRARAVEAGVGRRSVARASASTSTDLVDEAIAAFDALTLARPTPIARTIEPDLTVIGDRATLVRALVNLLTNAWKYTGDDKRIAVEARRPGGWIEISVQRQRHRHRRATSKARSSSSSSAGAARWPGRPASASGSRSCARSCAATAASSTFTSHASGTTVFRMRLRRRREPAANESPRRGVSA